MARVTATEVKGIMDNCIIVDAIIDSFIIAGTLVIDGVFGVSDVTDLTKEIERWFVAHMIASTIDKTASEEKVGDGSIKYTGQWGKKLESTPYGQMVLQIDLSGKMSKLGKNDAWLRAVPGPSSK